MQMMFCRGCGKEIHSSAPLCPHCGATQHHPNSASEKTGWLPIAAVLLGGLTFICAIQVETADRDEITGGILFGVLAILGASINLQQKKPGRGLSTTAIALSAISLLIYLGSLH